MTLDLAFKIVIFGEKQVGKSTLMRNYVSELTNSGIKSTMGLDIGVKRFTIENGKITLQIWDIAGDVNFKFLFPTYIRGSAGGIFMYDITRKSTLEKLDEWLIPLKQQFNGVNKQIPILIVGGKLDLQEKREVDIEDAIKLSKSHKILDVMECSGKTGQNVDNIFNVLTYNIMKNEGFQ